MPFRFLFPTSFPFIIAVTYRLHLRAFPGVPDVSRQRLAPIFLKPPDAFVVTILALATFIARGRGAALRLPGHQISLLRLLDGMVQRAATEVGIFLAKGDRRKEKDSDELVERHDFW